MCQIIGTTVSSVATAIAGDGVASGADFNGDVGITIEVITPNMHDGFYEGSTLPEESRKSVRLLDNYTQIFKTP
jgi:hypothetical protein